MAHGNLKISNINGDGTGTGFTLNYGKIPDGQYYQFSTEL